MNTLKPINKKTSLDELSIRALENSYSYNLPKIFEYATNSQLKCLYEDENNIVFILGKNPENKKYSIYKLETAGENKSFAANGKLIQSDNFNKVPVEYNNILDAEKSLEIFNGYRINSPYRELNGKEQTLVLLDLIKNDDNTLETLTEAENYVLENEEILTKDYIKKLHEDAEKDTFINDKFTNIYASIIHNSNKIENSIIKQKELGDIFPIMNEKKEGNVFETEIGVDAENINYFSKNINLDVKDSSIKLGIIKYPELSTENSTCYETYIQSGDNCESLNNKNYFLSRCVINNAVNKNFINKESLLVSLDDKKQKSTDRTFENKEQLKALNKFKYIVNRFYSFMNTYEEIIKNKNPVIKDFAKIFSGLKKEQRDEILKESFSKAEAYRKQNFEEQNNQQKISENNDSNKKERGGR